MSDFSVGMVLKVSKPDTYGVCTCVDDKGIEHRITHWQGSLLDTTFLLDGVRCFMARGEALAKIDCAHWFEVSGIKIGGSTVFVKVLKRELDGVLQPPAIVLSWQAGIGNLIANIREGRVTKSYPYDLEAAKVRGCPEPETLGELSRVWLEVAGKAICKGEYHPLAGGNGDLASFAIAGATEAWVKRPDLQAYHPRWVEAEGDLAELGDRVVVIFLAGNRGLQSVLNLARAKKVKLYACGTWGSNGNFPVSYRDPWDPLVCTKLAVNSDGLPVDGGASFRALLESCRPAGQPVKIFNWPGTFVTCHQGWRDLTDEVLTCQWKDNPPIALVGIDTSLRESTQDGENKIYVPLNYGFMAIGARDLGIDANGENVSLFRVDGGGAVVCAPYRSTVQVDMAWGKDQEFHGQVQIGPFGFRVLQ